jgi:hypothetical protein
MPELEGDDWWRRGKSFDEDDDSHDWDPDEEDEPVMRCRFCKEEIVDDDIVRCPYCDKYLSMEGDQPLQRAKWVTWTAILCFIVAVWSCFFFLR